MKVRGFEKISQYQDVDLTMPVRKTETSAGYDLCLAEDVDLEPGASVLAATGLKAYMRPDEYLSIHIRSSMGIKKHLRLLNSVGIVDADYYNNPDNEGHILIALENMGKEAVHLAKGERVAQGIFSKYLVTDDDSESAKEKRSGGFGSTGRQ